MGELAERPARLDKAAFLQYWKSLEPNQSIEPRPVPYKHSGSTYQEDSIRLTGSRAFIDSVLSRLQDLLQFDSTGTRLQVVYQQTAERETGALSDSWNCYVQVHQRGRESTVYREFVNRPKRESIQWCSCGGGAETGWVKDECAGTMGRYHKHCTACGGVTEMMTRSEFKPSEIED